MIIPATLASISDSATRIQSGQLVAIPTETVYGLGANALDPIAVTDIFKIKSRPLFDPLIVHIWPEAPISQWACVSPLAQQLMDRFWPGPLTIVLPKTNRIPGIVTAGLSTVGIRCPSHPVAMELLRTAQVPVAAPSANRFGRLSPTTAMHVEVEFPHIWILDGGPSEVGVESTVVSVDSKGVRVLRYGGISPDVIKDTVGSIEILVSSSSNPVAPGQLDSHYAPRTPLYIGNSNRQYSAYGRVGVLAWSVPVTGVAACEVLSVSENLQEAAATLFEKLHILDQLGLDAIFAQNVPEMGLGLAIMDRLKRASRVN